MDYLGEKNCTVISMSDLSLFVDPQKGPEDPYAPIRARMKREK